MNGTEGEVRAGDGARPQASPASTAPAAPDAPRVPDAPPADETGRAEATGGDGWGGTLRQSEPDDPLLDALVALTHLLECPTSRDALKAGLPLADGRMTPALLPRAAARAGLSGRLLARPLDRVPESTLPAVLLLKNRSACVLLERRADGRAVIVPPETGRGRLEVDLAALEADYAGHALFARPEARPREDRAAASNTAGWFWGTLWQNRGVYAQVLLAAVLINAFALTSSLFAMNVYDRVIPNNAVETLWVLSIGAFVVFGFDFVLRTMRGYFVDGAGRVADIKIASRIFEQVLGMKMASRPASAGAFANNLREYESLRDFFTSATVVALVDLPFALFFLAIVWLIGGIVVLVPAIIIPIVIAVGLALQVPLNRVVKQSFKESAAKHGVLIETINGLETIKSVSAEGRMQRSWERFVTATAHSSAKARFLSAITVNFSALAANLVYVGVVIVGVYQITSGAMTMGAVIACSIITGRAMAPLGQIAGLLTRFNQSRTALQSLNGVMALPVERPHDARFLHRPDIRGSVEFKNVVFAYPNQKLPALRDVSFKLRAGEKVGIIGRIGSGKTTIEKLVLALHEPQEGGVLIDGTDLRQIDPVDLRRRVGCVPQDVMLFAGSVRDNIALGAAYADDAAVLRAARLAGVEDFVARHPSGFDLPVGERGEALSGGQRQSIAIARALLLDPPILILDEPTSAMDNGAENRLKNRLAQGLGAKTLILVTHRASLLSLVERLIVMDGGRLIADGPRDEILRALSTGKLRTEV